MHCLLVLVYRRVDTAAHSSLVVVHGVVGKDAGGGDCRVSQNATWQGWWWGLGAACAVKACEMRKCGKRFIMSRKGPILSRP
jgi:hypothetical protein